jgi:hypothetical protein
MPLITKPEFIKLLSSYSQGNQNYIGMGNPNSDTLLVGSEKALDSTKEAEAPILNHELTLNFRHWFDIYMSYNSLNNPLDNMLLTRKGDLHSFNPFNPLLFKPTANLVGKHAGHTYAGITRLFNHYEDINGYTKTSLYDTSFAGSTFSRLFMTELSDRPAKNQTNAKFDLNSFFASDRYHFLVGSEGDYYRSFNNVIIYCGCNINYVGRKDSPESLKIIQIFNPSLSHGDLTTIPTGTTNLEIYKNGTGAKVILCRHLSSAFGHRVASVLANQL